MQGHLSKELWEMTPGEFAALYGFEASVTKGVIGGGYAGRTISVGDNRTMAKARAGDWTKKDAPDFITTMEYPENIRSATHEVAHGLFSTNPQKGHIALKELQEEGVPQGVAFESLIDLGGVYLLEPNAIRNTSIKAVIDRWLGDTKAIGSKTNPLETKAPDETVEKQPWEMTRKEIIRGIYDAVNADLIAGKSVPITGPYKTIWLKSPNSLRLKENKIQVYMGERRGWEQLADSTLDQWAKVKRIPGLLDHIIAISKAKDEGKSIPEKVLKDYPELVNVKGYLSNFSDPLMSPEVKTLIGMKIKIKRVDLKKKLGTYTGDILIQKDIEKIPKIRPVLYEYTPKIENDVICHETGHAIQLHLPDEWVAKFNDVKAKEFHPEGYNVTGAYRTGMTWPEDFAESFSKWVNHPELFRKNFPLRAGYFDELGLTVRIEKNTATIVRKEAHLSG